MLYSLLTLKHNFDVIYRQTWQKDVEILCNCNNKTRSLHVNTST